ncbi:hypothetical protein BP6252_02550 [Coleophoma cylindrospora]|uniref:Carboxylic ester hydrolase n=1 Tax=Coleophoma cylindrospora TaxID=1849047 RepID=A0A3D8SF30_9HELO|nr:hypothetical protein BP6252_02550 [Coleophoma cylindrospora]
MQLKHFLVFGLGSLAPAALATPTVTISNGTVIGRSLLEFKQDVFLGIPYSDPPTRFEVSVPRSTRFVAPGFDASNYSDICYGTDSATSGFNVSEDCLSINVIRPVGTSANSSLPVVIWMHGGGFWGGSSADPQLNGSYIVERSVALGSPIIFTSINYRLLFYGFPSGNEPHQAGIENLGLKDQRLAFKWVQENIAAFGGDASKVTVMGESAGGTGILQHMTAYGGRNDGLFRAAIIESGSFYDIPCNWNISAIREAKYQSFLNDTGCGDLDCLKTLDNDVLYNVSLTYYADFLPSIDGDFMTKHAVELFNEGNFVSVPLLMGVNNDEGNILINSGSNTTADIQSALTDLNASSYSIYEDAFTKLFELYPDDPAAGVPMNTGSGLLSTGIMDKTSYLIAGDAIEHSVRRWMTGLFAKAGNAVFSYRFTQVPWHALMSSGATHGTEITYVFGNTNPSISSPLGPRASDYRLSQFMTGAWVSFIHHLTPDPVNSSDLVLSWPDYRNSSQNMVFLADANSVEEDTYRQEGIELWTQQRILGCSGITAP